MVIGIYYWESGGYKILDRINGSLGRLYKSQPGPERNPLIDLNNDNNWKLLWL